MAAETLDEKLRKLGKEGIPSPSPGEESPSFAQEDLFRDAHKLLGDYLAERILAGAQGTFVEDFLRTAAPVVYYVEPTPNSKLEVGLLKRFDCAAFGEVSREVLSESLARTDSSQEGSSRAGDIGRDLPATWIAAAGAIHALRYFNMLEPYVLVMGMTPEHRALAAMAISAGMADGTLQAWDTNTIPIGQAMLRAVPTRSHFDEAARRYGVPAAQQKAVMEDLHRVAAAYLTTWREEDH